MPRSRNIYSPDSLERLIAERAPGPRDASAVIVRMCERYAEFVEAAIAKLDLSETRWRWAAEAWQSMPAGTSLAQARVLMRLSSLSQTAAVVDMLERGISPSD